MSTLDCVGIVGLGLIGGSLARDLAARGVRVHGCDRDQRAVRDAMQEGVVHAAFDTSMHELGPLDALVLAVPVPAALDFLHRAAAHAAHVPLITDVCSTKQTITTAAAGLGLGDRFIGGHPLAGDHRSGWAAARSGMFKGATVYVCPEPGSDDTALGTLGTMWSSVGARTHTVDAAAHDRLLAWTSHLPQAVATALARSLAGAGVPLDALGPGGRDMTRLAASSPDMWTPTALDNAAALCDAISALETGLADLREALVRSDDAAVRSFFELA